MTDSTPTEVPASTEADRVAPILVGYDGSSAADQAMRWAMAEAERRGADITVLQSWHEPILSARTWSERWDDPAFEEREASEALRHAIEEAGADHPGVSLASVLAPERAADALVSAAKHHQLVVVGSRGRGGFAALTLGSVAERVADRSPTTVVVVRGNAPESGDIVVGVDGSASSRRALRWAAEEGQTRSLPVRAVLAWTTLVPMGAHGAEPFGAAATDADARMALHQIVTEELGRPRADEIMQVAIYAGAAGALVEAASDAVLLVVGGPVQTGERHDHLTSVTRQILRHAPCPVVVTRGP